MTLNSINQYGHDFQIKVLSSLLTHKEFLVNIHDIISWILTKNSLCVNNDDNTLIWKSCPY